VCDEQTDRFVQVKSVLFFTETKRVSFWCVRKVLERAVFLLPELASMTS